MIGMPAHFIQIQIHSQPRPGGKVNITIDHRRIIRHEQLFPGLIEVLKDFLQPGVGSGGIDLHASHGANRPLSSMGDHQSIVSIHHVGDFP